jgi:hypothetical protein
MEDIPAECRFSSKRCIEHEYRGSLDSRSMVELRCGLAAVADNRRFVQVSGTDQQLLKPMSVNTAVVDYSAALASAVAWLGNRYLLAKPARRLTAVELSRLGAVRLNTDSLETSQVRVGNSP